MRDTINCFHQMLALLTLPIYLLMPLVALAGRALESLVPRPFPPWLAFITTDTFQVIAFGLFLWYLMIFALAIEKLQGRILTSCLDLFFVVLIEPFPSSYLLLAGVLLAGVAFKWLM